MYPIRRPPSTQCSFFYISICKIFLKLQVYRIQWYKLFCRNIQIWDLFETMQFPGNTLYINGHKQLIAFASRSLTKAEQNYSQLGRKALVCYVFLQRSCCDYFVVNHWRHNFGRGEGCKTVRLNPKN